VDWNFTGLKKNGYKDYRDDSFPAKDITKYIYSGFEKACHLEYKFDSRTEQIFAFILENDSKVMKWLRPAENQLFLWWHHNTRLYLPDFIVETAEKIFMIETKAANEMKSIEVLEKAKAAIKYCKYASEYTSAHNGKPWSYVLVPHDEVSKSNSFDGVVLHNMREGSDLKF
jgi:type III restriction enzyme